jgi:hypothetical protein
MPTTGVAWLDTVLIALAAAGAIVTPVVVIFRWAHPIAKQLTNFLEDWFGEPERPGVAAKPGVLLRLVKIERELRPNGGSSMRDAVNRVEATGDETSKRLDEHITTSEADRAEARADLRALTKTTAGLVKGQVQQDDVIANLSRALPNVAASHPPTEHEEG